MIAKWSDLIGNAHLASWFGSAIRQNRLGGSFLFVGPAGVGKRSVATLLAKTLLCNRNDPAAMDPCGQCEACAQVSAETHPDVIRVRKPDDKSQIPLDLLIGPPESRMQEGFCRDVRLSPYCGKQKVAILEDADYLNEEGANCLLKTLEEPPADCIIILIGSVEQKQLPTIRSRCQLIRFRPLTTPEATTLLRDRHQLDAEAETIEGAVKQSAGDIQAALRLLSEDSRQFQAKLLQVLQDRHPDPISIRRLLNDRLDAVGKETPKKRAVLRDIFSMVIRHYRQQMRVEAFQQSVHPITLARLDRSVRAVRELERMANLSSLVDCFAADLSLGTSEDRGAIGS
ncbi:MAG: DNA polymerase III subunit [Planctomycetota bacterium]